MSAAPRPQSSRDRGAPTATACASRACVRLWVPDTRPDFAAEAHRQSLRRAAAEEVRPSSTPSPTRSLTEGRVRRGELWTSREVGTTPPGRVPSSSCRTTASQQSVTVCPLTTDPTVRHCSASRSNRASATACLVSWPTRSPRCESRLGEALGSLDDEDILRLNRAVLVFLGFAAAPDRGATP